MMSQTDASWDLVNLSQEPGTTISDAAGQYIYDVKAGAGTAIYIMDTGFEEGFAKDLQSKFSTIRWIFPKTDLWSLPFTGKKGDYDDADNDLHGTIMAIKAAGHDYGVAKNADLVVVKGPTNRKGKAIGYSEYSFLAALNQIYQDVVDHQRQKKAVVNMSFSK